MNDTLEKTSGWRGALLGSLMGVAASSPIGTEHLPLIKPAAATRQPSAWDKTGLHPDLLPIAFLESSNGKFTNHQPNSRGVYYSATGALGVKPSSAHESYLKDKHIQAKYPDLVDKEKFTQKLKADPKFYNELASKMWSENALKFKDSLPQTIFAWRHGRRAAIDADKATVQNDPYVKGYLSYQAKPHEVKELASKPSTPKLPHTEGVITKSIATETIFDIYISWGVEGLDVDVEQAKRVDAIGFIKVMEARLHDANRVMETFALRYMGEIVTKVGVNDVGRVLVHQNALEELNPLKEEIQGIFDCKVSLGAGKNFDESDKALYICSNETPGKMVFFTPEIAYKIQCLQEGMAKSEADAHNAIQSDRDSKQRKWKEGFASKIGSKDGNPRHPKPHPPKEPPHTPATVPGLRQPKDILNTLVALAGKPKGLPKEDLEAIKSKIVKLLESFSKQTSEIEKLKETQPEVYSTLVKLITSITAIGRALPEGPKELGPVDPDTGKELEPVEKSEPKITQAAFLDTRSGTIYSTGPTHDIALLPDEFTPEHYTEGFLTSDNDFISREDVGGKQSADIVPKEG